MGQLVLSTPSSSGSSAGTTLVDRSLLQYFPQTIGAGGEQFMPWVYGSSTVDTNNIGVTRRAIMWNSASATTTLTFQSSWPDPITASGSSGAPVYEIFMRDERSRFLEAINEAVGQLGLWWYREFVDTSITTASNTWSYTAPSSQYIARLWQIEYQVNTDTSNVGFPYADAQDLNWELRESTDTSGTLTQTIQFGVLPPWPRTLRLRGEAYFPDLANDSDVLALSGEFERPCLAWIYAYAAFLLNDWQGNQQSVGEVQRYEQRSQMLMAQAEDLRNRMHKGHKSGRVVVPLRGRGLLGGTTVTDSRGWLAALHGAGN